jgi:hypothetical protein
MQHIDQSAAAMLVIHVPTNRCEPLYLIDKSRANLLAVSTVYEPRARVKTPCVNRQEKFRTDQS